MADPVSSNAALTQIDPKYATALPWFDDYALGMFMNLVLFALNLSPLHPKLYLFRHIAILFFFELNQHPRRGLVLQ